MSDPNDPPKIQIDSDWKAEAQAEKEKLAQAAESPSGAGPENQDFGGPGANHVRISFACSEDQINAGMDRFGKWVQSLG